MATGRRPTGWGWNRVSLAFFALAIVLAVVAIYLAVREEEAPGPPPPPPAEAGANELIHVVQALEAEDLTVEIAQRGVPAGGLSVPGQGLTVDGTPLYVFVYPNPAAAEAEAETDPTTILRTATGTPVATEAPRVFSHSNVTVALVGGSDELAEAVERAIAGLP